MVFLACPGRLRQIRLAIHAGLDGDPPIRIIDRRYKADHRSMIRGATGKLPAEQLHAKQQPGLLLRAQDLTRNGRQTHGDRDGYDDREPH